LVKLFLTLTLFLLLVSPTIGEALPPPSLVSQSFVPSSMPEIVRPGDRITPAIRFRYSDNTEEILPHTDFQWHVSNTNILLVRGNGAIDVLGQGERDTQFLQIRAILLRNPSIQVLAHITFTPERVTPRSLNGTVVRAQGGAPNGGLTNITFHFPSGEFIQPFPERPTLDIVVLNEVTGETIYRGRDSIFTLRDVPGNENFSFLISLVDRNNRTIRSVRRTLQTPNREAPVISGFSYNSTTRAFEVTASPFLPSQAAPGITQLYFSFNGGPLTHSNVVTNRILGERVQVTVTDLEGNSTTKSVTVALSYSSVMVSYLETEGGPSFPINRTRSFNLREVETTAVYNNLERRNVSGETVLRISQANMSFFVETGGALFFRNSLPEGTLIPAAITFTEGNVSVEKPIFLVYTADLPGWDAPPSERENLPFLQLQSSLRGTVFEADSQGFDLNEITFLAHYQGGITENLLLTDAGMDYVIETSPGSSALAFVDSDKVLRFSANAPFGSSVRVTFSYTHFLTRRSVSKTFVHVRQINRTVVGLSADRMLVHLPQGDAINFNDLGLKAHFSDGEIMDLTLHQVSVILQHYEKSVSSFDEWTGEFAFHSDAQIGTEVSIRTEFVYRGKTVFMEIVFLKSPERNGSVSEPPLKYALADVWGHWAEKDIFKMHELDLIPNQRDSFFHPDREATRAEVASFVARLLNLQESSPVPFVDILEYDWHYRDIAKVYAAGIFGGHGDNTFRPYQNITRQELAAIVLRVYKYKWSVVSTAINAPPFADDGEIECWARESVLETRSLQLMVGRPRNQFDPKDNTTRAEVIVILRRILDRG